ncbi:unnamed protein product [Clonostachys chloroleuca]|uniref:histidine kinase n=1 Tax=Clonostachys chloroleuca TaxID=1926264 RepID=A0AA35LUS8_9HYPO|nr:unnamed protein product [Clonostachys chloroleuca]
MTSTRRPGVSFFPRADAAVLSSQHEPLPAREQTVGPIYDPRNFDKPIDPWPLASGETLYPPKSAPFAPSSIPDKPPYVTEPYLRAFLARNERLRLSMLWYYTRGILDEPEFRAGLQEKVQLAQESTGWEFAIVGILDINFYIRIATVGVPVSVLPRGETLCAHTVTQPPGSIFLLPNMLEDWRYQKSPYAESGGLQAYAGAPLRLQSSDGDCVGLGSLCVASGTSQEPLTKIQQQTLVRLADWVSADIVQCARARRQKDRRRMWELAAVAQKEVDETSSQEPVFKILEAIYPEATITLQPSRDAQIDIEGQGSVPLSDFENGLWEDIDYIDDFIAKSNQREPPSTQVVRILTSPCESISGPSFLVISSRDFRLIFDDIDLWFVQLCATMISQLWHKLLLEEALVAKEKFLRGFSHQLRTPIHGILGSVELLAEVLKPKLPSGTTPPPSDAEEKSRAAEPSLYLDTIKIAGRDLISIVNSMITLNRWADIAMADRCYSVHTVHDLETELGDEIHKMLVEDPRYRSSIFFESTNDVPFKVDIGLLRDCLLPLVINAIQNTQDGMIKVKITAHTDAKELVVDIEDNGRGISPDDYQRIFEPYEKVDTHSGGAGLGLTLASKFATLLHGSITLESSSIDRGSLFRATFRKVEFSQPEISPPPLKLQSFSFQFYAKEPSSEELSLHNCFSFFLTRNGFTQSNQKEDCCVTLLDYFADVKHSDKPQILPGKVGVCLIPTTEKESYFEQASNDILFLTGPFLTSKMHSAIEEINRRLEKLENLPKDPPQTNAPPPNQPQLEEDLVEKELPAHPKPSEIPIPESAEPAAPEPEPANPAAPEVLPSPIPIAETREADLGSILISPTRAPKPTTLLVDDNAINLRIMQMYCTKRGLPYICAKDGREAVEAYSKHQVDAAEGKVSPIELIFMDLQMPVCDGIEATQTIRQLEKKKQWAESTVFIVTGQDSPADRAAADGAGAHEYYVKPVSVATLDLGVVRYFPAFEAK